MAQNMFLNSNLTLTAPARIGIVAPTDVIVPPGSTGLDPSQTNFFQICVLKVLNITTRISKGSVETITPVELIKKGIRPFAYGFVILAVYDNGSVFSPEVLNLTEDDLVEKFTAGVSTTASLSLSIKYPTLAAAPHVFVDAYKNLLAVAVETEYCYPLAELEGGSKGSGAAPPSAIADEEDIELSDEDDEMLLDIFS
ncbi:60S ribosomal protein L10P, insertion domain [Dillenia turbinata]|uniref:60S ribosomal protein L10P, insertion domain n=1 Tax=Dillenia turbinata TaxID=194707 RepID=A0AAN8VBK8_9MAGN